MRSESVRFYADLRGCGKFVQAMLGLKQHKYNDSSPSRKRKIQIPKYEKVGQKFDENIIPQPT